MIMDEIRRSGNAFSRAVYNQMRQDVGCPPVLAKRLSPAHWGWYVEMKDGSFSIDLISDVADVWEAKCKCIEGWQESRKNVEDTLDKWWREWDLKEYLHSIKVQKDT